MRDTLEGLITTYLEHCELEKNLTQNTIKMYDFYLRDFMQWLQGFTNNKTPAIADLEYETIRKYRIDLNRRISSKSNEEYKRTTTTTHLVALRAFLKYLITEHSLDVLSPDSIPLGKAEDRLPKVLNEEQLKRLFSQQNLSKRSGIRDRAILELLFSTGLRVSELCSLNVDTINIESGEFTVIGKGRKARTVYLSDSAKYWVKRYLGVRRDNFRPLFIRYSGKSMDDGDIDGESLRLTARTIQRVVKKYTAKAGISVDATPHTLRHSFATGLLRQGADLRSVQELLGHSDVSTTQIYTHITNKQLKETHERFHKDLTGNLVDTPVVKESTSSLLDSVDASENSEDISRLF